MADAGNATPSPDSADAERVLLDHAVRCWDAEVENAARYERERRLLLTAILAIVGFGVLKLLSTDAGRSWVAACMFWPLAVLSVGLFFAAFVSVIAGRSASEQAKALEDNPADTASFLLRLPDDVAGGELSLNLDDALRLARDRTYTAYLDLQQRNAHTKTRVRQGGAYFIAALVIAAAASIIVVADSGLSADERPATPAEQASHAGQPQPHER